jgi:hypothetical protein
MLGKMAGKLCTGCWRRLTARNRSASNPNLCQRCKDYQERTLFLENTKDEITPSSESAEKSKPENFHPIGQKVQSNEKRIAIQSARIVNGYGTYIQIFGVVIGILIIIGGFLLESQTGLAIYKIAGVIIGLLDIAIFAVQGAVFRMISNYVIARLTE